MFSRSITDDSKSIIDDSRSIIYDCRSIIDDSRSMIDDFRSITDDSRSIIGNSRSIIDNSRVMLRVVASFTIVIYDRHIFIVQATDQQFIYIVTLAKNPKAELLQIFNVRCRCENPF
jgi:hypothetical protein